LNWVLWTLTESLILIYFKSYKVRITTLTNKTN
jgi:hypothetical protein